MWRQTIANRAAVQALTICSTSLRFSVVDATTAASLLCGARAARAKELANKAKELESYCNRLLFACTADVCSDTHQDAYPDDTTGNGSAPSTKEREE